MNKIILVEEPHLVIQGEGPNTNTKMLLIRVADCPLRCSSCDSKHTWVSSKDNIIFGINKFHNLLTQYATKYNVDHILLTGGEPGLYIDFLKEYFEEYQDAFLWEWDIETAGVYSFEDIYKWGESIQFNFSPKIGSLKPKNNMELEGLNILPPNFIIKVVTDKINFIADESEILHFQARYAIANRYIYLMPKGIDRDTIIKESQWIIERLKTLPYQFSSRQHILIYDNKKLV